MISSSSKRSWFDLLPDPSVKSIKEETFDSDITEIPSLQTNDIDYTIIDSQIDPLDPKNHPSIGKNSSEKSDVKNKKTETTKRK
jgi:hypothetical protein